MNVKKQNPSETKTKSQLLKSLISVYTQITFSFVNPLLKQGTAGNIDEASAFNVHPLKEAIQESTVAFNEIYTKLKKQDKSNERIEKNLVMHSLIRQYTSNFILQLLLVVLSMGMRFLGPFSLRWFLTWLDDYKNGSREHSEGWIRASLLCAYPFLYMIVDHQLFWVGYRIAYKMKMSMMAAIHEKLLKLNASSVAKISTGFVVNLASNDVERFEDACEFWMYLIFGPIEAILVLVCVSLVLGFLPAISGLGCILILGPLQGLLSKHIAKYRVKAAQVTDKRINLMGELISGILAVKMLGWEDPLLKDVASLRHKEHNLLKRMNYTVANIFALSGVVSWAF